MGNEFFGFSPESFEQFVRALSIAVFGPGVRAFGNGPDGGREATFRGEVPYPYPPNTCWAGYGVIQAKCKEKSESTHIDQEWALRLLKEELDAFVISSKRHPKPEYYVFVTNVELSSVAGGGKDRADQLIQNYYGQLPLKGHEVWDANQLTALLSVNEQLRRRFREFLTTGDILSAMLTEIEQRQPNTTRTLSMFLERELRSDEASRLDQAGNRTDEQLRLSQVFFDLPASRQPQIAPPEERVDASGRLPPGVLWEMLRAGSRKLDPKTLYEQETSPADEEKQFAARYVLLGGPGSGKSTLGQFLAQIHRAALLQRREPHLLEPQTRRIIQETRDLCSSEGLPWPVTPRYPFRVELNRFAKTLATSNSIRTLADYLISGLRNDGALTRENLLEWMSTYPSLLIFDGLDEVPSSSNRKDVIRTVDDFVSEARQVGADIFIVATSRHQGYTGEFSSGSVALRHILPLSPIRALRYVQAYANSRFAATNPNKAQEVIDKLRDSSRRPLTAQLMSSPLQVTFMATVVAAKGDPGEDRWQLFNGYYRTIYDRERQKAVPPYDTVLGKQQPTIDRLHHDIGFWLQYRGETAGGTAVSLPIETFEKLVDDYLTEIGRDGEDKRDLVALITEAARTRLVFLTSRVEGELSFDVRSLQEYMAAECIMSGDPELAKVRLKSIAPSPYWRNVFLFSVSKCFGDTHSRHLQDAIRVLCEDLNSSTDRFLAATKPGSELALDILQSGAVSENPNYSRHLARIGLSLLQQPYLSGGVQDGPSADERLAAAYSDFLANVYREDLDLRLGQADFSRSLGAWPLLLRLLEKGVPWAKDLFHRYWPSSMDRLMLLAPVIIGTANVLEAKNKIEEALQKASLSEAFAFLRIFPRDQESSGLLGAMFDLFRLSTCEVEIPLHIPGITHTGCRFGLVSIRRAGDAGEIYAKLSQMQGYHSDWFPFVLADELLDSPEKETLARILDRCADGGWNPSERSYLSSLPWPLALALQMTHSAHDLHEIANLLRGPVDSGSKDWLTMEDQWITEGVTLGDALDNCRRFTHLDILLGIGGIPVFGGWTISSGEYPTASLRELYNATQVAPPGQLRRALTWFLCVAGTYDGCLTDCIDPAQLRALLEEKGLRKITWYEDYVRLAKTSENLDGWLEFFDWLGRSDYLSPSYQGNGDTQDLEWCEILQEAFLRGAEPHMVSLGTVQRAQAPERLGLLRLLSRLAYSGRKVDLVPPHILDLTLYSEPRFRLAALVVRLAQRSLQADEAQQFACAAVALLSPPAEENALHLLIGAIESHETGGNGALCEFVYQLRQGIPATIPLGTAQCERLLRRMVRGRSISLQSLEELRRLRLPVIAGSIRRSPVEP